MWQCFPRSKTKILVALVVGQTTIVTIQWRYFMSKLIYVKAGLHTELLARLLPSVGYRALFWLIQYRIPEILNMHVLLHCQGEENVVSELPKLIAGTDSDLAAGFPIVVCIP